MAESLTMARRAMAECEDIKQGFLATISHEVRNPLNAIIGLSSILIKDGAPRFSEQENLMVRYIRDSGEKLLEMMEDVLFLSRLYMEEWTVQEDHFNPVELLMELQIFMQGLLHGRADIQFELQYEGLPDHVLGDREALRRIVMHLLDNAVKFTGKGHVCLRAATEDAEYLRISVSDTGIGIPEEALPRIFTEFYRAKNAKAMEVEGTGLGLVIAKKNVRLAVQRNRVKRIIRESFFHWFAKSGHKVEKAASGGEAYLARAEAAAAHPEYQDDGRQGGRTHQHEHDHDLVAHRFQRVGPGQYLSGHHARDERPVYYPLEQLEAANTHDEYWNAAQKEMICRGKMHGYMRMYWGKKILEWCETPEKAYQTTLAINNKFFLDGRDPNSYAGVGWIFGLHDRAWFERSIFGKIRYMAASGLERKCDIEGYVRKIDKRVRGLEK